MLGTKLNTATRSWWIVSCWACVSACLCSFSPEPALLLMVPPWNNGWIGQFLSCIGVRVSFYYFLLVLLGILRKKILWPDLVEEQNDTWLVVASPRNDKLKFLCHLWIFPVKMHGPFQGFPLGIETYLLGVRPVFVTWRTCRLGSPWSVQALKNSASNHPVTQAFLQSQRQLWRISLAVDASPKTGASLAALFWPCSLAAVDA